MFNFCHHSRQLFVIFAAGSLHLAVQLTRHRVSTSRFVLFAAGLTQQAIQLIIIYSLSRPSAVGSLWQSCPARHRSSCIFRSV
jgi:hypothetical protein